MIDPAYSRETIQDHSTLWGVFQKTEEDKQSIGKGMAENSPAMDRESEANVEEKKWRERLKEGTGEGPNGLSKCECYYEYKGEVCLEQGYLQIKYAVCANSRAVMEKMIRNLTGVEEKTRQEKEKAAPDAEQIHSRENESQLYLFAM
jgi:hypothetical protein